MPPPVFHRPQHPARFHFPSANTILFARILIVAALTWIIPVGQSARDASEAFGKDVPFAGTYAPTKATLQGMSDVLLTQTVGFYDPGSNRAMARLKGQEKWMIPIPTNCSRWAKRPMAWPKKRWLSISCSPPVMITAGYDALTAVAVMLLGAGIGALGATVKAFSAVITSDAAGGPCTERLMLRLGILVLTFAANVAYVMRHAERVRADPSRSLIFDLEASTKGHFGALSEAAATEFTGLHKIILLLFAAGFAVMIWGVALGGWRMAEMSALFLFAGIGIGLVGRLGEKGFVHAFLGGARPSGRGADHRVCARHRCRDGCRSHHRYDPVPGRRKRHRPEQHRFHQRHVLDRGGSASPS